MCKSKLSIVFTYAIVLFLYTDLCSAADCEATTLSEAVEGVAATFKYTDGGSDGLTPVSEYAYCMTNEVSTFEVHVIALNDADGTEFGFFDEVIGDIKLRMHQTSETKSRPVKLVLNTVNPTNWIIYTNGVNVEDIVVTSKSVGHGSVVIEDSSSIRIWKLHSDYGYKAGWNSEEELLWAVHDWFGFATSYTATEHASEVIVNAGIPDAVAEVNLQNTGVYFHKSCNVPGNHPFTRAVFKSSLNREGSGCYSARVQNNQELYVLSVDGGESSSGSMVFGTGRVKVNVYQFAEESLHPLSLVLTSNNNALAWDIKVASGITITNITVICPERYSASCEAVVIDDNDATLNIPTKIVQETLGFDLDEMKPSVEYVRRQYGYVTSYAGVYRASQFDLGVGVNVDTGSTDSDYEIVVEPSTSTTTTTVAPEESHVEVDVVPEDDAGSVKPTEEEMDDYYQQLYEDYYYDVQAKKEKEAKEKAQKNKNIKSAKGKLGAATDSASTVGSSILLISLLLGLFL